jgi:hypothetical protein
VGILAAVVVIRRARRLIERVALAGPYNGHLSHALDALTLYVEESMTTEDPRPSDADFATCISCKRPIPGVPLVRDPRGFAIHDACQSTIEPADDEGPDVTHFHEEDTP